MMICGLKSRILQVPDVMLTVLRSIRPTRELNLVLRHVLPSGFVRVRHYWLLANRHRRENLCGAGKRSARS